MNNLDFNTSKGIIFGAPTLFARLHLQHDHRGIQRSSHSGSETSSSEVGHKLSTQSPFPFSLFPCNNASTSYSCFLVDFLYKEKGCSHFFFKQRGIKKKSLRV